MMGGQWIATGLRASSVGSMGVWEAASVLGAGLCLRGPFSSTRRRGVALPLLPAVFQGPWSRRPGATCQPALQPFPIFLCNLRTWSNLELDGGLLGLCQALTHPGALVLCRAC